MGNSTRLITRNMKSFCALLALVAAASSSPLVPKLDSLEYGFCDGSPEPGSLTASVDPFPVVIAAGADVICTDYFPEGQACGLPLGPGMYGGDPPLVLEVPEIPAIIGDLLGSGTYYAIATITTPEGATFACIYIRVELAN